MNKAEHIESESFRIIADEMRRTFDSLELPIVRRVIHASGDMDYENIILFHPQAVIAGIQSIRQGKDIFTDVHMVEAGINKKLLAFFGIHTRCLISDDKVAALADKRKLTRSESAVEMAVAQITDNPRGRPLGILAIGNAPTALAASVRLADEGTFIPDLIIGVPVGFVQAQESKEELAGKTYPFITCLGRKGGSPIAAAIINALLLLAKDDKS